MGFLPFYLCAFLPMIVGGILLAANDRYTWQEWILSTVLSFGIAGGCHALAWSGMTGDEETWSGQVTSVQYQPPWTERYEEAVYKTVTDSKGNTSTEFSHYETRYAHHSEEWTAHSNIGDFGLNQAHYNQLVGVFGGHTKAVRGDRSGSHGGSMSSGDENDYLTVNETGHIEPVAKSVRFENRVKASPSVFSYRALSEAEKGRLPAYPATTNPWQTGRSMNSGIPPADWDELNAVLGPTKFVNLIIVRMSSADESRNLEAAWVGGKKNDLVLTYGDGWARVFGWTDSSLVKRNLEGLLAEHKVDRGIIPAIKAEVVANYRKTDWHKFDYLDLQPRPLHYVLMIVAQVVIGTLSFWFCLANQWTKAGPRVFGYSMAYPTFHRRRW